MDFWGSHPPPAPFCGNSSHLPKAGSQRGPAGLVERGKGGCRAVGSRHGPSAPSPPLSAGPHHTAPPYPGLQAGRRACPGGVLGTPFDVGETAPGHCPGGSACHLLAPILPMTNKAISLSSLSPDFNVMCPRQLLNILNVSLTRTNPVEFFSNFPIR